jgi:hypothetical protein
MEGILAARGIGEIRRPAGPPPGLPPGAAPTNVRILCQD